MVEVRDLTKNYGPVKAVKDVSFSLGKEQVLGFLGPNGAGKTTVMKILTGYHFPTAGRLLLTGSGSTKNLLKLKSASVTCRKAFHCTAILQLTNICHLWRTRGLFPLTTEKTRLTEALKPAALPLSATVK